MALSRINGDEELFVGGVFAMSGLASRENNFTHILSVIDYSLQNYASLRDKVRHMSIDIDDDEDSDLLVHFPKMVRFINQALHPDDPSLAPSNTNGEDTTPTTSDSPSLKPGVVYVHCAMGKSRSISAIVAYLLYKHPSRYGAADRRNPDREAAARAAVDQAVHWVRQTREIAEPNPGFMEQLRMWWLMGCPADSDDAVERHPVYQRWLYRREVEQSVKIGRAPDWVRFEDEEKTADEDDDAKDAGGPRREVRCKKCRRVLTTERFIVSHASARPQQPACPHVFVEPLSWMRSVLEDGALEGRLVCPGAKCGASIGRFAWQGFKCSCGEWVCPAFSLQRSKIDEVTVAGRVGGTGPRDPRAALGIRMPPSLRKENL